MVRGRGRSSLGLPSIGGSDVLVIVGLLGPFVLFEVNLDVFEAISIILGSAVLSSFLSGTVHVLQVPAQISALGKGLIAVLAGEGPLTSMFSEVISQVARLLENTSATFVHALEK